MKAKTVSSQFIKKSRVYHEDGQKYTITVKIRYDDECKNGHNLFSITGDIDRIAKNGRKVAHSGGCIHNEIAKHFPEYAKYIKWHLTSSDGPMYYLENTLYFSKGVPEFRDEYWFYLEDKLIKIVDGKEKAAMIKKYGDNAVFKDYPNPLAKEPDFDAARHCAIWPEATDEEITSKEKLLARLPKLMEEFRADMRELGFTRESIGTEL